MSISYVREDAGVNPLRNLWRHSDVDRERYMHLEPHLVNIRNETPRLHHGYVRFNILLNFSNVSTNKSDLAPHAETHAAMALRKWAASPPSQVSQAVLASNIPYSSTLHRSAFDGDRGLDWAEPRLKHTQSATMLTRM